MWASFVQSLVTRKGKWPGSVWEEPMEGKERHWNEINRTKRSKAFSGHQRVSECFVKAGLRALISQLWSIHRTLCWPSDPQVKDMWIREEQVNNKCNWSEIQVTLKCPRWNASARRVSRECLPRAGCRPKSHFYLEFCSLGGISGVIKKWRQPAEISKPVYKIVFLFLLFGVFLFFAVWC